ncbi:MAG: hypothetical protein KKD75_01515 [Nanoarchaeota archaeon]|nr:hypothetical protein [Nanoarchaeota archaeon]
MKNLNNLEKLVYSGILASSISAAGLSASACGDTINNYYSSNNTTTIGSAGMGGDAGSGGATGGSAGIGGNAGSGGATGGSAGMGGDAGSGGSLGGSAGMGGNAGSGGSLGGSAGMGGSAGSGGDQGGQGGSAGMGGSSGTTYAIEMLVKQGDTTDDVYSTINGTPITLSVGVPYNLAGGETITVTEKLKESGATSNYSVKFKFENACPENNEVLMWYSPAILNDVAFGVNNMPFALNINDKYSFSNGKEITLDSKLLQNYISGQKGATVTVKCEE